jgi:hypothetical protein
MSTFLVLPQGICGASRWRAGGSATRTGCVAGTRPVQMDLAAAAAAVAAQHNGCTRVCCRVQGMLC